MENVNKLILNCIKKITLILLGFAGSFSSHGFEYVAEVKFRIINNLPKACNNIYSLTLFYDDGTGSKQLKVETGTTTKFLTAKQMNKEDEWPYIGIQENVQIPCPDLLGIDAMCDPKGRGKGKDNACLNVGVNTKTCEVTLKDCQYPRFFKINEPYSLNGKFRYTVTPTRNSDGSCDLTVNRINPILPKYQGVCEP